MASLPGLKHTNTDKTNIYDNIPGLINKRKKTRFKNQHLNNKHSSNTNIILDNCGYL